MGLKHTYITADGEKTDHNFTRGKAIRAKCLDCSVGQVAEVRLCTATNCPLFVYRMGSVRRGLLKG